MTTPLRPHRPAHESLDQTLDIETPEQVVVSYTIAGLGSRTFAALVDYAVCLAGLLALVLAFLLVAPRSFLEARGAASGAWAVAIVYIAQFAFVWGYYVLCEGLADGRTVGKRMFRLRVVHDDGFSISFGASAIRNLFRIIDLQPGIIGTVGMVAIAMSSRGKRLGDSVAGTIVVHERPLSVVLETPRETPEGVAIGEPVLSDSEFDLLSRFMQRRTSLPPEERSRLAARVAERLRAHLPPASGDAAAIVRLHERESSLRARGVAGRSDTGAARERHALVAHGATRWREYSTMLERTRGRSLKRMTESEVSEFAARYREISSDLARLRTASRANAIDDVFYLSRLVAAGHNLLYRREGTQLAGALKFLSLEVPAEVRRSWRHVALAAVFLFLPWTIAHVGVVRDPQIAAEFLPLELLERAEQSRSEASRRYVEVPELFRPVMASQIIANNVQVSIGAFAFGVTGIGTILLLVFNGISLGGVTGLYASKGVMPALLGFIAPHGVLELTAITISGGAGLLLASALLLPGGRTRRDALVENGRRAIRLMAAVVIFLVVAGVVEGLISPADSSLRAKLAISGATAVALLLYLVPKGRRAPSDPDID
ncbi:MAG: stage II sporulation protein M [Gemmatimonadaceae bacterium]|nr:stage II sporulation protein M [Gemmatimonadaceae bacterium]